MAPASSSSIAIQSQSSFALLKIKGSSMHLMCVEAGMYMSTEVGVVGGVDSGVESALGDVLGDSVSGELKKSYSSPSSSLRL
jgi:hypothetical protein